MEDQLQLEREHLESIQDIARGQIAALQEEAANAESDIMQAKQDMRNETSHSIGNLWGSDAFEQLAELSQFATQISDEITSYETIMQTLQKLERLLLSPYFARIDFTFPGKQAPTPIYIGRTSLKQRNRILIHDWRAPVASLFYRHNLGPASYTAPAGTINGEVSLKRQYEISDGELEYFFDADIEILDEYLRKLLSQNASPQMKSIVETIQREQDIVIRDAKNDVLIVQGVAGSGKTSVALHRVAYLMYTGLDDRLGNQNIVILSPNNVFERYISNVLPELGEQSVNSFVLEELYHSILGVRASRSMQTRFEWMEQLMLGKAWWAPTAKSSLAFKCSESFMRILDAVKISGRKIADIREAYTELFTIEGRLQSMAQQLDIELPDNTDDIIQYTKENLASPTLYFDDASALAYLNLKRRGMEEFNHIRQVVIDEAQDYYFLQYQILKLLFPNAKYTILGDINQTIDKPEDMGFYQQVLDVIGKKRSSIVTLEKSFRCTNEIIRFSARIMGSDIQAFGRDGSRPAVVQLQNETDVQPLMRDAQACLADGYQSVGIICKSQADCRALYAQLKDSMDVSLLDSSASGNISGVFILPVYLSKGLEFDAAFIWGADGTRYGSDSDKSLLFISCTRPLHCLRLYHWNELSPYCDMAYASAEA